MMIDIRDPKTLRQIVPVRGSAHLNCQLSTDEMAAITSIHELDRTK